MIILAKNAVKRSNAWIQKNVLKLSHTQLAKDTFKGLVCIKGDMRLILGSGLQEFKGTGWSREFYPSNLMLF